MEGPLKIITVEDCHSRIQMHTERLKSVPDTDYGDKEKLMEAAGIAIWETILKHVYQGCIITLDSEERVQMWDNVAEV
jgi:hypothetical protein